MGGRESFTERGLLSVSYLPSRLETEFSRQNQVQPGERERGRKLNCPLLEGANIFKGATQYCIINIKLPKRLDLNYSHHKKKISCNVIEVLTIPTMASYYNT